MKPVCEGLSLLIINAGVPGVTLKDDIRRRGRPDIDMNHNDVGSLKS